MTFFPDSKTLLSISLFGFDFSIQWYAAIIVSAACLAYYLSKRNAKTYRNIDLNGFLSDCFIYVLWCGMIGARLWFCLFYNLEYYIENPINIIKVWDGGLAIHGAVISGAIFMYYYCKRKNVSYAKIADCILPTVMLAQGIGRWGNYINQECHGVEVDATYFDGILAFLKEGMNIGNHYYEPLFFYESVSCIIGFFAINYLLRKFQNKRGDLAWAYLLWYGVVRFFIEGKRTDSLMIGSLKTAQVISILMFVAGLLGYLGLIDKLFKKKKPTIVFDFDGTLVDSQECIIETYKELFRKYDKEENFTAERQTEVLGPSLFEMFEKFFPNEDKNKLLEEYNDYFHNEAIKYLKPMKNAKETLQALKDNGYNIGILSTRTKESGSILMDKLGIGEYIDSYYGYYEVKEIKPSIDGLVRIVNENKFNSNDVIYIGDSVADMKCGLDYGAYTIAYLFNENKANAVLALNPNRNISDLSEILNIVKENHYFTYNLR